ncbi:Ran-binding protein in the microtubule-organising centre protein (macronuclear) [Tetrahymena thermophila SB210]|uniref:Ran-binding protein in the microtubule-organising centre protein n=1 Tax=Tetrahymena thermophila (strain SB210) TaxID=312017 RepID=Q22VX6_TETTS|nr:Ran-binding protein in the microtubule-organising centre protein [Tetrahymena thermophila SB210]EAR89640.3 Ran-binding protein in the microtubule-organising centre protein [Tetrahymena thermophila SB210]|eukprot:XP_001009886.3 Ran-binding protein in the microtubule-organising centre protein [Tetrahymena thermophila SB210]
MKNIDYNISSSISQNLNHYQQILLNPEYLPNKQNTKIRVPTIKRKYSPNLKFCNDGESVKYIRKPIDTSFVYSNFQTDYVSSREDIIFYYEVEMIEMSDQSDICVGLGISTFPVHKQPGFSKKAKCSFGCKKNGEIRCSKIKSTQKVKPWGQGNVIGCGYNYITNEIFFTNDGEYKAAFTIVRNYQFIGIISLSYFRDKVRINFGQRPFKFDIRSLIADYKAQIQKQISTQKCDLFEVHKLVQQYLYLNGYFDSLQSFENLSLLSPINNLMECEENSNQNNLEASFLDKYLNQDKSPINQSQKSNKEDQFLNKDFKIENDLRREEKEILQMQEENQLEIQNIYDAYDDILDFSNKYQESLEEDFVQEKIQTELNNGGSVESSKNIDHKNIDQKEIEMNHLLEEKNDEMKTNQKSKQINNITQNKNSDYIQNGKYAIFDNIRKEILGYLQQLNYAKIIEILQKNFPNIFLTNPQLEGKLVSLQFLKMYKDGKQEESMKYAQMHFRQMSDIKFECVDKIGQKKIFSKLDILGAFCYENIENTHLNLLFQTQTQCNLWDEINTFLLQHCGYREESSLQIILKQVNLVQNKMREAEMFESQMFKI